MDEALVVIAPVVDGFDQFAGAQVVHVKEFRAAQRFGASGTMNSVSRIEHRVAKARQVVDGAQANLNLR